MAKPNGMGRANDIVATFGCLSLLAYVLFAVYSLIPGVAGALDRRLGIETFRKVVCGANQMTVVRLGKGAPAESGSFDDTRSPRLMAMFRSATRFQPAVPQGKRDYLILVMQYRHRMRLAGYPAFYYDARTGILTDGHDQCKLPAAFGTELERLLRAKQTGGLGPRSGHSTAAADLGRRAIEGASARRQTDSDSTRPRSAW